MVKSKYLEENMANAVRYNIELKERIQKLSKQ